MDENRKKALVLCLIAIFSGALALQAASAIALSTAASSPSNTNTNGGLGPGRYFDYVLIIMMENKNYEDVIGSTSSPYLTGLANQYALPTNFHNSNDGGSTPNYLTITTGGSPAWATCNAPPSQCSGFVPINTTITDRLESKGLTWKAYMEGMPSNCYAGNAEYYVGPDNSVYYPRHDPFIYFQSVIKNPSECNRVVPAGANDTALLNDLSSPSAASNFMWLTPNGCDQSHDCGAAQGDSYLSVLIPKILSSQVFQTENAAIFLTYDEGSSGNHIPTILIGPAVKASYKSNIWYDHYSMLKTIETNWNLAPLTSHDNSATPMTEFFRTRTIPPLIPSISTNITSLAIRQNITLSGLAKGGVSPYSYKWSLGDSNATVKGPTVTHDYALAGIYNVTLTVVDLANVTATTGLQLTVTLPYIEPPANPVITVPEVKSTSVGAPISFMVTAHSSSPRLIILSATNLPTGANFTSIPGNPAIGSFSWIPTDRSIGGFYNVMFRAQESGSASFNLRSVTIQVTSKTSICTMCDLLAKAPTLYLFTAGSILLSLISVAGFAVYPAYRPRPKARIIFSLISIHRKRNLKTPEQLVKLRHLNPPGKRSMQSRMPSHDPKKSSKNKFHTISTNAPASKYRTNRRNPKRHNRLIPKKLPNQPKPT